MLSNVNNSTAQDEPASKGPVQAVVNFEGAPVNNMGPAQEEGEAQANTLEPVGDRPRASVNFNSTVHADSVTNQQPVGANGNFKGVSVSNEGLVQEEGGALSSTSETVKNRSRAIANFSVGVYESESDSDGEGTSDRPAKLRSTNLTLDFERLSNGSSRTHDADLSRYDNDGPTPAKVAKLDSSDVPAAESPFEWHTLATLSSKMFTGVVDLTDEQKAELNQVCAAVEEMGVSERVPYMPDAYYQETKEILARCFSEETLQNQRAIPQLSKEIKKAKSVQESPIDKPIPFLLYSYGFKDGVVGSNGAQIAERATCIGQAHGANSVYNSEDFRFVQTKIGRALPPSKFFEARGFPLAAEGEVGELLPVVELDVNDPDLEAKATSLSTCIISGCNSLIDIDAFTIAKLKEISGDTKMTVLRQRPQASTRNQRMRGSKKETLEYHGEPEEHRVVDVLDNYEKIVETAKEGYINCTSSFPIQESAVRAMEQSLKEAQLPCLTATGQEKYPIITFGTNVDVGEAEEQMRAIEKLPEFVKPHRRLMSVIPDKMSGINQVQVYVKSPGCRTSGHFENQSIGSININIGDDDVVWFCVPMRFAATLERLLCEHSLWPYHTEAWPTEESLRNAGISFFKILQKKGDMVYTNTGTYHFVQSNGFSRAISWNTLLDDASQLAAAALFCDHNTTQSYNSALPLEKVLWSIAIEKRNMDTEFSRLVKRLLICSLAHCRMESEYFTAKGYEIRSEEDCPYYLETNVTCSTPKCTRNTLFNLFVMKSSGRGSATKIYCGNCYETMRGKQADRKKNIEMYQKFTQDALIQYFDSYF